MPKVAIIGAGLIGRSFAAVFAGAGFDISLTDTSADALAAAPGLVEAELRSLERHGLLRDAAEVLTRIATSPRLEDAVADATLVQECGPERLADKIAIFERLDRAAPADALLCSSSSAIIASAFTRDLAGRARCLIAHPANPPHLIPIIELCGAPWTEPGQITRAKEIYLAAGQVPVVLRKEVEGFVLNRLQGAVLAEAFRLVGDGVISPQDLDATVRDGLGLRWSFMGPFATIELNAPGGMRDYCERYTGFYRRVAAEPPPPAVYDAASIDVIASQWPARDRAALDTLSTWRNERLAALKAHKRAQASAPDTTG